MRSVTLSPHSSALDGFLSKRGRSRYFVVYVMIVGSLIGTFVALAAYVMKPMIVCALPVGIAAILPTLLLKNFRLYWFCIYLMSLQFTLTKNLNDGRAIIDSLKIDYTIDYFTFDISATDLSFLVLVGIWVYDRLVYRTPLRFPSLSWLAVAYMCIAFLSALGSDSFYLAMVEMSRQLRFAFVYIYAVNCINSKRTVRFLAILGIIILTTQGGVTLARHLTGYLTPISLGDTQQDATQIEQYLAIDRNEEGSGERGFGTLGSPGSTVRLCMMVIPFAVFLSTVSQKTRVRLTLAALTAFGIVGLAFTYTRVYFITTAVQLTLIFLMMVRGRMLRRQEITAIVMLAVVGLAVISPKIYAQFTIRTDSSSVRLLQYEASAKMILDHPLLGVGINNATAQQRNYSNLSFDEKDPETQFFLEQTHNFYIRLTSEVGVIAAFLFLAFFGRVTFEAWRQSNSPDPEIRWIASALLVAYLGAWVNSVMDPLDETSVLHLLCLFAGITLNLSRMAQLPNGQRAPLVPRYGL